MTGKTYSYQDLLVWQKAAKLAIATYELTESFPKEEQYGLCSQMQRAAVSIASNIAEGRHSATRKTYIQFLRIARGSAAELSTQIFIAKHISKTQNCDFLPVDDLLIEIRKMLDSMIFKLKAR
jgi:four helix bundle protein